jgi:hypothetical protein
MLVMAALCCAGSMAAPATAGAQDAGAAKATARKSRHKSPPAPANVGKLDAAEACPGSRQLTSQAEFHHYTVRTYREPNPAGCFIIFRDKKKIFSETGVLFQIGGSPQSADDPNELVRMGADVTGDGKPDLVIGRWSGAAGCCYAIEVFEVGSDFRKVTEIELQRSADAEFADVDNDGRLELVAADWTFAEWHAPLADSPAPQVLLRFRDGAFHLAADVMKKPVARPAELDAKLQQVVADPGWENPQDPPSRLWATMLDLIYSGNALEAWNFCDDAWPAGRPGKAEFIKDFRAQLARSPYWADLKALPGNASLDTAS